MLCSRCGKTTLLQKMRYWAAISAYQDDSGAEPTPVCAPGFPART